MTGIPETKPRLPEVLSELYQRKFEEHAKIMGLDPQDPWVGGYLEYEWNHLRHILGAYKIQCQGMSILEFGCNVGASSILYACLGAKVCAIDVDQEFVKLAQLNAMRYKIENINFLYVKDTRSLPYSDSSFDLVSCNSVLEYVEADMLRAVQIEIDRTIKIGGKVLVTGTSNRLYPREVHSGMWLANYLPRSIDRILGKRLQRGVFPWEIRQGFGKKYHNIDCQNRGRAFVNSRLKMGGNEKKIKAYSALVSRLGIGPGLLAPNISCLLQKTA